MLNLEPSWAGLTQALSGGKRLPVRMDSAAAAWACATDKFTDGKLGQVMQKNLISLTILGFFLIGPLVGLGHALEFDGIPYRTGSWSQGFIEHSVGLFDTLKVEMVSPEPSSFKYLVFLDFDASDWTPTSNSPDLGKPGPPARKLKRCNLRCISPVSLPILWPLNSGPWRAVRAEKSENPPSCHGAAAPGTSNTIMMIPIVLLSSSPSRARSCSYARAWPVWRPMPGGGKGSRCLSSNITGTF